MNWYQSIGTTPNSFKVILDNALKHATSTISNDYNNIKTGCNAIKTQGPLFWIKGKCIETSSKITESFFRDLDEASKISTRAFVWTNKKLDELGEAIAPNNKEFKIVLKILLLRAIFDIKVSEPV